MQGFGAGFAAMSLRKFKSRPAIPISEYWRAVATIVNTPVQDLTSTHYMVLKGLVRDYAEKFVEFYGQAAVALLHVAIIELPQRASPKTQNAAAALAVCADVSFNMISVF